VCSLSPLIQDFPKDFYRNHNRENSLIRVTFEVGATLIIERAPVGFVFKLQANMDPKHRDRVAFLRIVSGKFERGMKVKVERTGKALALTRPQKLFAQVYTAMQKSRKSRLTRVWHGATENGP
jgi:translation elongation factor EF-G